MNVTNSIAEYIKKNDERRNLRWRYRDGELMFEYDEGLWFNEKHLDELFPVYQYKRFNDKGQNPDTTKFN